MKLVQKQLQNAEGVNFWGKVSNIWIPENLIFFALYWHVIFHVYMTNDGKVPKLPHSWQKTLCIRALSNANRLLNHIRSSEKQHKCRHRDKLLHKLCTRPTFAEVPGCENYLSTVLTNTSSTATLPYNEAQLAYSRPLLCLLTSKASQTGQAFGMQSGFISRSDWSVQARLQVSVCSNYNLFHSGQHQTAFWPAYSILFTPFKTYAAHLHKCLALFYILANN